MLKIENLSYFYKDGDFKRYVLKDINCEFKAGTFYTIVGQSGSGKTTLLSVLAAMDKIQSGTITLNDNTYASIGLEKLRRNYVGMVFQSYNLIRYMTGVENVLVAMSITDNEMPTNAKETAYNLLDYLGIARTKANRVVNRLSGGEQQRVAIARALATNVDLILADEPTGNLDVDTEAEIIEIFKELAHTHKKCVVIVTHSPEIAAKSDISYVLKKGVLEIQER